MVTVSELQDKSGVEEITLEIVEVQDVREVRGGALKVQNVVGKDETGQVTVALWNDDCEKFAMGDKIKIVKGWSSDYNGNMQLSSGKFGSVEKLE